MYTKAQFKDEILNMIILRGYDPVSVAKMAHNIFIKYQREIDQDLYELLLDIANMDMGEEYEMKEQEFKKFLKEA